MKKIIACAVAAALVGASGASFAQLGGLTSLVGGGSKSSEGSADLSGQQAALVKNYVAANVDVLNANAKMGEALGLKTQAEQAEAVIAQLKSGATDDKAAASKAATAVGDTSGAIAAKLKEKPVLDDASKKTFAQGLGHLALGLVHYVGMRNDVTSMGNNMKSASPMALTSLGGAAYVVSNFPGSVTEAGKALKNAVDFARSNGIEVPSDATKALAAL
ncbi:hypothetical protein [Pandoraea pulmonicola]|uniref:Uncharacterized protein n=1 Tax=Pandoraea pulmonicola TaxID=93221 RepID=A0AAJ5D193_PANPU|nr:hypothetical protein [Pandoraea pulmonicola]AJC20163.1 hypothetical protein RO07_06280 [Pandoraea pulmonicola]SUA91508.1 Uncharacterised protein [Pandoraea pulmonicola]